ncbi:GNAT family N-acetyltransferase [Mesobacillus jeotgali]|uniref:GNAT family N-acetyltransferase n=1 Tax=Mesobacillus jeotgali TaxID=129985 RepID=UPI0017858A40|nr:GNAT family N-acetyltransferase [Mesobacillus jeotgali]UYZ23803.1 GNAT family N-acetyltransferase [Mesobacillus jeotgali]
MVKVDVYTETERLVLRPFKRDDYHNWYKQFDNRLPSQYRHDDGRPSNLDVYTEDWFAEWVSNFDQSAKEDKRYNLGVFRKEDGVNVGKIELMTIMRMDYQWAMMGYSIHNQFWKKGYGIESVVAARELFFNRLDFHRIELHIHVDNLPSINLAKKAGFIYECVRKDFSLENDRWTDFCIYYQNRS